VADGLQHPETERLAACGAAGKYVQNIERDMHRKFRADYGGKIQVYYITITIKALDKPGNEEVQFPCLAPHEMFGEIYRQGSHPYLYDHILLDPHCNQCLQEQSQASVPGGHGCNGAGARRVHTTMTLVTGEDVFEKAFCGPDGPKSVSDYWSHQRDVDVEFIANHPANAVPSLWDHTIPLDTYEDAAEYINEDEALCFSISSPLSKGYYILQVRWVWMGVGGWAM
jgi:hypothetical protein